MAKPKVKPQVVELVAREKDAGVESVNHDYERAVELSLTQGAAERMGALKALSGVQRSIDAYLTSQRLRAIQFFCGNRDNLTAYGCTTTDEFLNRYGEEIGVTRSEYWNRIKLLEGEGDATYDALNTLGIPLKPRKMLQGAVALSDDGEEFLIGGERIAARNKTDLLAAIAAMHQERLKDKAVIEAGKEDVQRLRREINELRERPSPTPNPRGKESSQLQLAAAFVCTALTDFNAAYAEASQDERDAFFISHGGTAEFLLRKALSCVPRSLAAAANWMDGDISPEALQDEEE
jgi:hypothetical protein